MTDLTPQTAHELADPQDEHENKATNKSGNRSFAAVLQSASRRSVLKGSLAAAATTGFLAPQFAGNQAQARARGVGRGGALVEFDPLTIADATVNDRVPSISDDYQYQAFIPWGTPITPGATKAYEGDPNTRPTPEEAALQIGIGHDGMWFYPMDPELAQVNPRLASRQGMLCINHEFGRNSHVLGKNAPESLDDVRVSQHAHGVSVVAIEETRRNGWEVIDSPNSRRIHVNTPMEFTGPAASSNSLDNEAGNTPLGTVNNCGSGPTPWGTYLTCEENFNGYFGWTDESFVPNESQQRYGFSSGGFGYGWHFFDARFDLSNPQFSNEYNRFGWVVEIDPYNGMTTPKKRTAMGRFKHEAVAIAVSGNGRIAAYMGDDQRFDYCYKYVSDNPFQAELDNGNSPLDNGKLYVAKFNDDGTGEWLLLSVDNPALFGQFQDQADLLINTRLAADILGATPMDRPEWTTIGQNGSVFWTLTNNSQRGTSGTTPKGDPRPGADAANPQAPNSDGHIIRTVDDNDHLGTTFTWEIMILASDTRGTPNVFTDPDAAYADPFGRLFIGTDGGQPDGLQDQLVVIDTTAETPEPRRLLTGVASDEITGWTQTPDFRTAFTNIQHPGNGNPGSTNFPGPDGSGLIPRDCTLILRRKNRGVIGS